MAYKALYRTYRPQKFSEVIGQEAIVRTLQNALATGKITHAYLFSGPRGTGKTTVARIFAKALNCDHAPTSEPCGECTSCREIAESNNPDVIEIDAASNNGVDEIRDIREKVKFLPGGSKYKIYIIDEVHMLSQGAFNALLKTLEEPPKHVIFILATTEPYKVIPTILSRCQRYDFKSLSVKEIKEQLEKVAKTEHLKISDEALIAIAESAEGGMRDAFSYMDQAASFADDEITIDDVNSVTGNLNYDKTIELAQYLESSNINLALTTINDLLAAGKEISKIVNSILQFYRDLLLFKNVDISTTSKYIYEKPAFRELAKNINEAKIFYYVDAISDVQAKIKTSITPHIYLEVAIIKMINIRDEDLDLIKRLKLIEEEMGKLKQGGLVSTGNEEPVNNEKINDIDYRLSRVVQELSKLELHKLSERVLLLESNKQEPGVNNDKQSEAAIILQANFEELKKQINDYQKQIDERLGKATPMPSVDAKTMMSFVQEELKPIHLEISQLKESLNKLKLQPELTRETSLQPKTNNQTIQEQLAVLENKVYKLMTNMLATTTAKKPKQKASEGQIVLFGNEVTELETFEKPIKTQFDFEEYQKTPIEKEISQALTENDQQSEPEKELIKEEPIIINETRPLHVKNDKPLFEQPKVIKPEEKPGVKELTVTDFTEVETKNVQTTIIENQEIIDRPHSQLVRKLNPEKQEIEHMTVKDLDESKPKPAVVEKPKPEPEPIIKPIEHEEVKPQLSIAKTIEKILHESRNETARNDRPRVQKLWETIGKSVNAEQRIISDLLQEGIIVAVGEKAIVIVYPNAALCNQVMRPKFKKDALRIVYNCLGDTYDYLAIPDYLWKEKRNEYVGQYNIGTSLPVLTEIDDPSLMFDESTDELEGMDKKIDQVKSLFGEDFVKVE
ncbi:MAG: DNA polymerase III subunit gamma/tau [Bacilli bacterium]